VTTWADRANPWAIELLDALAKERQLPVKSVGAERALALLPGPTTPDGERATMIERTTRKSVTFLHPFALSGVEGEQPAGTYSVETTEEPISDVSFIAYRRMATTIMLASPQFGPASRQIVDIDPQDLEAAQLRDAEKT
jgi:hypothetical protein